MITGHRTGAHVLAAMAAAGLTCLPFALFVIGAPTARAAEDSVTPTLEAARILRGRYLVKATGCNDCHTPDYATTAGKIAESQWLVGDRLGFQGPWGTTYPANLRRLVQSLSVEQWLVFARRETRPPMPWFALRDLTDADLTSMYYFIRSLGPAGDAPPACRKILAASNIRGTSRDASHWSSKDGVSVRHCARLPGPERVQTSAN